MARARPTLRRPSRPPPPAYVPPRGERAWLAFVRLALVVCAAGVLVAAFGTVHFIVARSLLWVPAFIGTAAGLLLGAQLFHQMLAVSIRHDVAAHRARQAAPSATNAASAASAASARKAEARAADAQDPPFWVDKLSQRVARCRRLQELRAPQVIIDNERRMIRDAIAQLAPEQALSVLQSWEELSERLAPEARGRTVAADEAN